MTLCPIYIYVVNVTSVVSTPISSCSRETEDYITYLIYTRQKKGTSLAKIFNEKQKFIFALKMKKKSFYCEFWYS